MMTTQMILQTTKVQMLNPISPLFLATCILVLQKKQCSFNALQKAHPDDPAFHQFRACFAKLLNELLQRDNSPVQCLNDDPVFVTDKDFMNYLLILKHDGLLIVTMFS